VAAEKQLRSRKKIMDAVGAKTASKRKAKGSREPRRHMLMG
jgi:hypothetical protein